MATPTHLFRWLRYVGGPLHGRTALMAWLPDGEAPEQLTVMVGPYHFARDPKTRFIVRVDDGDPVPHRYELTTDDLLVHEREIEEEQKRQVEEDDPERPGKKLKQTVVELVKRTVPIIAHGGYRYVGPGAWPTEEADMVAATPQEG